METLSGEATVLNSVGSVNIPNPVMLKPAFVQTVVQSDILNLRCVNGVRSIRKYYIEAFNKMIIEIGMLSFFSFTLKRLCPVLEFNPDFNKLPKFYFFPFMRAVLYSLDQQVVT